MVLICVSWIIYEEFNKWNRKKIIHMKNKSDSYLTSDMQINSKEACAYLAPGLSLNSKAVLSPALWYRSNGFQGHSKMSSQTQLLCLLVMGFQGKHVSHCRF